MLFRKKMEPRCIYCKHATVIDEKTVLCLKKGVTDGGNSCRGFAYDPFLRTPPPQAVPDFSKLKDENFTF